MAQMLQVNTTLRHLDLGDTDQVMFLKNDSVDFVYIEIYFGFFEIQKIESLIALSTILNYNSTLVSLNINRPVPNYQYNNWMDEIAQHFASMLKVNVSLKELHMQKYEMRDFGAQWFSEKLVHNFHILHLDLSR